MRFFPVAKTLGLGPCALDQAQKRSYQSGGTGRYFGDFLYGVLSSLPYDHLCSVKFHALDVRKRLDERFWLPFCNKFVNFLKSTIVDQHF